MSANACVYYGTNRAVAERKKGKQRNISSFDTRTNARPSWIRNRNVSASLPRAPEKSRFHYLITLYASMAVCGRVAAREVGRRVCVNASNSSRRINCGADFVPFSSVTGLSGRQEALFSQSSPDGSRKSGITGDFKGSHPARCALSYRRRRCCKTTTIPLVFCARAASWSRSWSMEIS